VPDIADSSSVLDTSRVLVQHQAALTLLQTRLIALAPNAILRWLDLACGRGQIIAHLNENISDARRAALAYYAFDIDHEGLRAAGRAAEKLGLASHETAVGDLRTFAALYPGELRFDFITFTNAVHEVSPTEIAQVFADCMLKLTPDGQLFVYDMETIDPPELGAIPWSGDDAAKIVRTLLDSFGCLDYSPEVGRWKHSKTTGWSVVLERKHMRPMDELVGLRDAVISQTARTIRDVMTERLGRCKRALEMLTRYGAASKEEKLDKQRLLYELWAITRVLEARR
jgi:SAM-dependent methyltransferase